MTQSETTSAAGGGETKPGDLTFCSTWETKRQISHHEAREIASRLIASHFRRGDTEQARIGIPARPDYDDDLLINSYIKQQARRDAALAGPTVKGGTEAPADPLVAYLERQWSWSKETFGPALRTKGIVQHITKELREIEADPHDLAEWVDVIILAMDGFWRHGGKPSDLLPAMQAKQDRNFARTWPDWRTMGEDQAIEHDRSGEAR